MKIAVSGSPKGTQTLTKWSKRKSAEEQNLPNSIISEIDGKLYDYVPTGIYENGAVDILGGGLISDYSPAVANSPLEGKYIQFQRDGKLVGERVISVYANGYVRTVGSVLDFHIVKPSKGALEKAESKFVGRFAVVMRADGTAYEE
jgi:hypothetical protein